MDAGTPGVILQRGGEIPAPEIDGREGRMNDENPRDVASDGGSSSTDDRSALSAVGALMEQRRQFETWIAALESRRAETPKHVFTRVHADYTARLDAVIGKLVAHAGGLRAELTTLATKLASLDEQQHRARDERAETELRAHVGELTPDAWKHAAAASDATLASLTAQHAAAEDDLRRAREMLADAERPPTPVPSSAAIPVAAAATAPPPNGAAPAGAPPAVKSPNGSFDELAFLSSVVDPSAAAEPKAPAAKPSAPPAAAAPLRREPFAPRKPEPRPEPRPEERIVKQGEGAPQAIQPTKGGGQSLAANISGNNPIVLKDKTTESAKTLKCAECGAMNYPTEWYCERCGAELASL
jgi:hypothetical protein